MRREALNREALIRLALDPQRSRGPGCGDAAPLVDLLAAVRRQARAWIWVESLAWLAIAATAAFWATLLFDWAVEPPAWARGAALACAAAALGWIVVRKLLGRLSVPLPDETLALLVERTHPGFDDSLSTAVELATQRERPSPVAAADGGIDPELAGRTTAAAIARVGAVQPGRLFRRRELSILACVGGLAAASVAGLATTQPAVAAHWARRMLRLDDRPWPRRVSLEAEGFSGGVRTVARGDDVDVIVRARAAGGPPRLVELRSRPSGGAGGWRTERMGSRGADADGAESFGHVLSDVATDTDVEVRGGDARLRGLRLRVVDPPAVAEIAIAYELPAYLGGGTRRASPARLVRIPRGSRVRLECTATKPLSAGRIALREAGPGGGPPAGEREIATLAPADEATAPRAMAAAIDRLDADTTVIVRFTDTDGISPREPAIFALEAVPDSPPQLTVRLAGISTAVTPRARLPVEGVIADDHGLADATVRIVRTQAGGSAPATETRLAIDRVRGGGSVELSPAAPEWVRLEPLAAAVGDRLEVSVEARDACTLDGSPQVGLSDTWTLDIVTPEALQGILSAREMLLRRRFETAVADLAQARDRLVAVVPATADEPPAAVARAGEAASRVAGETADVAAAFRQIRAELDHNALLTGEVDARLVGQIAEPLEAIADRSLRDLARDCRTTAAAVPAVAARFDDALARMRAVLDRMVELESFNEVLDRLRGVIRGQEALRDETMKRQKQRGREALESP